MPKKADPFSGYGDKIIRMFAILLFARRPLSTSELMEKLDCSKQTVGRLRDAILKSFPEVPLLITKQGREHCYELKPEERPWGARLTEDEMNLLWMLRGLSERLLGKDHFHRVTEALDKAKLPNTDEAEDPFPHFASMLHGTIDYTPHQETIRTLIDAMNRKRVCRVFYKGSSSTGAKKFYVKPLKMFSYKNTLYLHAQMAKDPEKSFIPPEFDPILAVHRFQGVEIPDDKSPFAVPGDYDFDKAFNNTFGIIKDRPFTVEAEFTGWAAKYVAERKWAYEQECSEQGDTVRIRLEASSEDEVLSWILSFGSCGRLLGPKALVKKLKDELDRTTEGY